MDDLKKAKKEEWKRLEKDALEHYRKSMKNEEKRKEEIKNEGESNKI